jgi:hypothetical protein
VNGNPDPQLTALAWIVFGTLAVCVAAIVALLRSGRSVPPLGGVTLGGSGRDAESGGPPDEPASPRRARVSGASRPTAAAGRPSARGR